MVDARYGMLFMLKLKKWRWLTYFVLLNFIVYYSNMPTKLLLVVARCVLALFGSFVCNLYFYLHLGTTAAGAVPQRFFVVGTIYFILVMPLGEEET